MEESLTFVRLELTSHVPFEVMQAIARPVRPLAMDTLSSFGSVVSKVMPSEHATGDGCMAPL